MPLSFLNDPQPSDVVQSDSQLKKKHALKEKNTSKESCSYMLRCYTIPDFILKEEQELLEFYSLETLQDLFFKVYEELFLLATLMKNFDECGESNGEFIQIIGRQLAYSLDFYNRLCSIIADFTETTP